MTTNIVELLRNPPPHMGQDNWQVLCNKAADVIARLQTMLAASERLKRGYFDEIERLRAQLSWIDSDPEQMAQAKIVRLRAALKAFAEHFGPLEDNHMLHPEARRCFKLARTALEQKP